MRNFEGDGGLNGPLDAGKVLIHVIYHEMQTELTSGEFTP